MINFILFLGYMVVFAVAYFIVTVGVFMIQDGWNNFKNKIYIKGYKDGYKKARFKYKKIERND